MKKYLRFTGNTSRVENSKENICPKLKNPIMAVAIAMVFMFSVSNRAIAQNCSVNSGVPETLCANETLTLYGTTSGLLESPETTHWSQVGGPAALITHPDSLITTVSGIIGGQTYTFRISSNCLDGSLVFDDVVITTLSVTTADAGADQTLCSGTDVGNLAANTPGAGETGEWNFVGSARGITITDDSSPTSLISLSSTNCGTAILVWAITSSDDCVSRDTVYITNLGGVAY
ncbi:MAG: hypothetical protein B6D64_13015 [Bacteroidetes bacterium 4484_276]|nr:MAG: hypothetical protein B6D64_13015 [Bacteroidetes bacterium 4484_276]